MPGMKQGQVYSYPQKQWRKRKYQYLKYFMQPKRFDPEAEMHTISQVENPSANISSNIPPNEDSNTSDKDGKEWPYYDEDGFMDDDGGEGGGNSDSDFEYEDTYSRKRKSGRGSKGGGNNRSSRGGPSKVNFGNFGNNKRRTHADNIPDSEKPFSCERKYFKRAQQRVIFDWAIYYSLVTLTNLSLSTLVNQQHQYGMGETNVSLICLMSCDCSMWCQI